MKVLFSGYHNPHFYTITEYMETALRGLNHTVIMFDDRQHIIPGRIRQRVPWLHGIDGRFINRSLVALARDTDPEVALITGGHRISAATVRTLSAQGIRTVLYTTDPPTDFGPVLNNAPAYDFIFCQGSEAIEMFDRSGIRGASLVPAACDPEFHHPIVLPEAERATYACEVAFVGSYYPNRWELFRELTDFDFHVWGPSWDKVGAVKPSNIMLHSGFFKPEDWLRIYSGAKMVIVAHYQDGTTPCYQASPKVFEALACNRLVLVDRQKDVFFLFQEGEHLVGYSSVDDLKTKLRYYLDHPVERERISASGYEEVTSRHTYRHRIEQMLRIVGDTTSRRPDGTSPGIHQTEK
jgi:spore maturation protein CgeB